MQRYYMPYEALQRVAQEEGRIVYVTHTLPRRPGEVDRRIDDSPHQVYSEVIGQSVSIRIALVASIIGV